MAASTREPLPRRHWTTRDSWAAATERQIVRRALGFSIVVGVILIGINHADALLAGELDAVRLVKIGLTLLVPYAVSTLSSVASLRDEHRRSPTEGQSP